MNQTKEQLKANKAAYARGAYARAYQVAYRKTERAKNAREKYESSVTGKASRAAKRNSIDGKAYHKKYAATPKAKAGQKEYASRPESRLLRKKNESRPEVVEKQRGWLLQKYNLTVEDYYFLLNKQNKLCAICSRAPNGKRLHVDHCHKTGRVRGLLCFKCNAGIGMLDDSPILLAKAVDYLK